jgi:hypothetical protein
MIDVHDGSIIIPGGENIAPGASESQFLSTQTGRSAALVIDNGDYRTYRVETRDLAALAYFHKGRLSSVDLVVTMPGDEAGWDGVSEVGEKKRKAKHDEVLRKFLGDPPYVYPWGKVESTYDARDVTSSVVVTYV